MKYDKRLPFRNCGFEFTAQLEKGRRYRRKKTPNEIIRDMPYTTIRTMSQIPNFNLDDWVRAISKMASEANPKIVLQRAKNFNHFPEWIREKSHNDDDCLEIPTPVVKTREDVKRYYLEFLHCTKEAKMTTIVNDAKSLLGGCHIHISMDEFAPKGFWRKKKTFERARLFFSNLVTFITNYPELNWAFNDPNDTLNAVSMFFVQVFGFSVDTPGVSEKIWNEFREGRISVSAYEATMVIPTSSDKDCPVNFNNEHRTAEFRIFDMPESLTQHMLHVEVAQKIFDHVARITDSGGVVPLEIDTNFFYELDRQSDMKDPKQYHKSWSLSKKRFRNVMKMLEIDPKRCRTQLRNIDTRFIWHSQTSDKCYLR